MATWSAPQTLPRSLERYQQQNDQEMRDIVQGAISQLRRELHEYMAAELSLTLEEFADDTAAEAGGIAIGGLYRTGSAVKVRVT